MLKFKNDLHSESVKRVACCGIWEAKQCAIKASKELAECGSDVSKLYELLPSDPLARRDVLDRCSEYAENSAVCIPDQTSSWFSLHSLITTLVIIMSITICTLIIFKIVQKRM